MPKRVLVLDVQILQTAAFDRGMGKYTLSLLKALTHSEAFSRKYRFILLFNNNLLNNVDHIRRIEESAPNSKSVFLDLPVNIAADTEAKYQNAQERITGFVVSQLKINKHVDYLITAPFFVDFASVFPAIQNIGKYSLVYDLIPYRIWRKQRIFPDEIYFKHFKLFLDANHLFTISQAVNQDLVNILGIDSDKVTTIDGGPFEIPQNHNSKERLKSDPFILYPSAPIIHKNNERAIQGFEIFNRKHNNKYKLILTSNFDSATRSRLSKLSDNVIFSGNVSDQELAYYYQTADALLFASLSEGLGMPVLEAVFNDLPVACSRIPVLEEISSKSFYLFDPLKPKEIADALTSCVAHSGWRLKHQGYKAIRSKYTWERAAKILGDQISKQLSNEPQMKEQLLVIAKDPSGNTPSARMLEFIYAALCQHYDVVCHLQTVRRSQLPSYVPFVKAGTNNDDLNKFTKVLAIGISPKIMPKPVAAQKILQLRTGRISVVERALRRVLPINQINIKSRKFFIDKGLNLPGWNYYLNKNQNPLSASELVTHIKNRLK